MQYVRQRIFQECWCLLTHYPQCYVLRNRESNRSSALSARTSAEVLNRLGFSVSRPALVFAMYLLELPLVLVRELRSISLCALVANICIACRRDAP